MSIVSEKPVAGGASYLLRMTPEIKDAAKALTSIHFTEPAFEEGFINSIWLRSMNQALLYLVKKGVRATLPHVEAQLAETIEEYKTYEEIMTVLTNSPSLGFVMPHNFPQGSRARTYLEQLAQQDEGEDNGRGGRLDRSEAAEEYANHNSSCSG